MPDSPIESPADTSNFVPEQNLAVLGIELAQKAALIQVEGSQADQASKLTLAQQELVNADNPNRFSLAQRRLESGGNWTNETRLLAVEINQADQEQRNELPITFDDAKAKVQSWADSDMASSDNDTRRNGRQLDSALRGLSRPDPATQQESVGAMLDEVENILAAYEQYVDVRTAGFEAEVREYRAVRDALVLKQAAVKAGLDKKAQDKEEEAQSRTMADEARSKIDDIQIGTAEDNLKPEAPDEASSSLAERVKGSLDTAGPYNNSKGVEAVLTVAADLGFSEEQLTSSLLPSFEQLVLQSQTNNPDKPPEAHAAFAANKVFQSMEQNPDLKRLLDNVDVFVGARKEKFGLNGSWSINQLIITDFLKAAYSSTRS